MENLDKQQLKDLVLTKAMYDSIGKLDRWNSLNDIVDELFENGVLDREEYSHSIFVLTNLDLVESDIKHEEDVETSEAVGYEIVGLTPKGVEYIATIKKDKTVGAKIIKFFEEFDNLCGRIADSGVVKLTKTVIFPLYQNILS